MNVIKGTILFIWTLFTEILYVTLTKNTTICFNKDKKVYELVLIFYKP